MSAHGCCGVPHWDHSRLSSPASPGSFLDFDFTSIHLHFWHYPRLCWVRKSILNPSNKTLKKTFAQGMAALCTVKTIVCILGNHIFCRPRILLPSRLGTFKRQRLYLLHFSCLWHMPFSPRGWGIRGVLYALLGERRRHDPYPSKSLERLAGETESHQINPTPGLVTVNWWQHWLSPLLREREERRVRGTFPTEAMLPEVGSQYVLTEK